jgi:hypothetical protein
MVLFAKGDDHYSQGQRPWMDAKRAVFANGDNQPVGVPVVVHPSACRLLFTDQRDKMRPIEYGLWPNMLGGGHIPGAKPLAMLNVALGQKTSEGFAYLGTALDMAFGHGFVRQRRHSISISPKRIVHQMRCHSDSGIRGIRLETISFGGALLEI